MGLWQYLFGEKPKYTNVGYSTFMTTYTRDTGDKVDVKHMAILAMTEDGKRQASYLSSPLFPKPECDYILNHHPFKMVVELWVKGGDFPENFKAFNDTLGEMLTRLVTEKLKGEIDD